MEDLFLLSDGSDITVPFDIVKETFQTDGDLENHIIGCCELGLNMKVVTKGPEILSLSVI